ncbi:MAG: response regulator transcription factor [Saprospiraceae bacterium]|nr:response regulator transcription factor [Saprospiraceae bacterium]
MAAQQRILMVDDDRTFSTLTQEFLESRGLHVTLVHSGEEGLRAFREEGPFQLCILDVRMPFKDGFSLAADIRAADALVPLIFLTAQQEKESRLKGFQLGGDDYITKPFSMEELFLRIQAIWRRTQSGQAGLQAAKTELQVGQYRFSPLARELRLGDTVQKLSAIESNLLRMFCESPEGMIDRDTALRRIWSDDDMLRGRSLNVYVSKLRHYLAGDPHIEILNVHGSGYRMVVKA